MNIFKFFEEELQSIIQNLQGAGSLAANLDVSRVVFELPRDAAQRGNGAGQASWHETARSCRNAGVTAWSA